MGKLTVDISALVEESKANATDLFRDADIAYQLARDLLSGEDPNITKDTVLKLLDYFSAKLGRKIQPNDILSYKTDDELKNT